MAGRPARPAVIRAAPLTRGKSVAAEYPAAARQAGQTRGEGAGRSETAMLEIVVSEATIGVAWQANARAASALECCLRSDAYFSFTFGRHGTAVPVQPQTDILFTSVVFQLPFHFTFFSALGHLVWASALLNIGPASRPPLLSMMT